jgi:hypothetical protein
VNKIFVQDGGKEQREGNCQKKDLHIDLLGILYTITNLAFYSISGLFWSDSPRKLNVFSIAEFFLKVGYCAVFVFQSLCHVPDTAEFQGCTQGGSEVA